MDTQAIPNHSGQDTESKDGSGFEKRIELHPLDVCCLALNLESALRYLKQQEGLLEKLYEMTRDNYPKPDQTPTDRQDQFEQISFPKNTHSTNPEKPASVPFLINQEYWGEWENNLEGLQQRGLSWISILNHIYRNLHRKDLLIDGKTLDKRLRTFDDLRTKYSLEKN